MSSINVPYYLPTFLAAIRWLTQLASVGNSDSFSRFSMSKTQRNYTTRDRKPVKVCIMIQWLRRTILIWLMGTNMLTRL